MKRRESILSFSCLIALTASGLTATAQDSPRPREGREKDVRIFIEKDGAAGHMAPGVTFFEDFIIHDPYSFLASEMSFAPRKVVKGAPFSAEAVTETTRTLSDGNRIVRSTTKKIYRDSEGRTRREESAGSFGPWMIADEQRQRIFINDPVAGTHFVLDPKNRTAGNAWIGMPSEGAEGNRHIVRINRSEQGMKTEVIDLNKKKESNGMDERTESLGKQNVEGVEAEGTRTVNTIPAGAIGNERPIEIVSEQWYSPELQVVVKHRHFDPRMGESLYRLTNINRADQPAHLFQVPSDYTIKDRSNEIKRRVKIHREEKY